MAVTEIFHITHVSNLPRIIQTGGLWSDADRLRLGLEVTNIGHSHIKERRLRTPLPASVAQGTFVGQYVPFYCAPRSPMLYTINLGNVSGYEDGQRPVVHLVMQAEVFPAGECVVSDGNASDALTKFYAGHSALRTKVDWPLMTERFWNDTDEDGDRKRRRQAEFLVHKFVHWERTVAIGVIDSEMEKAVRVILNGQLHKPTVVVRGEWYY